MSEFPTELPTDAAARKLIPLCSGVLDYFPSALIEVAKCSQRGNDQHNPGQPLHWARGKSADHLDALLRHLLERDLVGVAWRALAALQMDCEARGAPLARGAREPMPATIAEAIALADGVTATGAGLIPADLAARMIRDGVVPADDDEGRVPAEQPREHA